MAITFNNTVFAANFWGVDLSALTPPFTVNSPDTRSLTLNGTVTNPGDTVAYTLSDGGSGTATATAFDDAGVIVFRIEDVAVILSNTVVGNGQVFTFSNNALGDFIVPCFAAGTRILTLRGEIAVEHLVVGDEVVAMLSGGLAAITWIGRRTVDCNALRHPAELWPIRVRADAFGLGQPHTDLFLSPDHAVHEDGVLVPIRYLENGTSIARAPRDEVTYFHIELDRHEVVLADGLATETYLDTGNRADFTGADRDPANALADERAARAVWATQACAPLHVDGPVVRGIHARLSARAGELGMTASDDHGLCLRADGVNHAPVRDGDAWVFTLPETTRGARLVSDSFVPASVFLNGIDHRCLGVPVVDIAIDGTALRLDDAVLHRTGWHHAEDSLRWTAGAAELPPLRQLRVVLASIRRQPGPLANAA